MKMPFVIIFILFTRLVCPAQPGALDSSFDAGLPPYVDIRAIAVQSDGKIIIGGFYVTLNQHIARLHPDGSLDTTFGVGSGANGYIATIGIQNDGKILIGGVLSSFNGVSSAGIARLNWDGTLDTTFQVGTGFNHTVETIIMQSDGKILVGGQFTSYDNFPINRICRLNIDGSLDTTFNPGTGVNSTVESILPIPGGSMMIGGDFQIFNGSYFVRIARVNADGSLDSSFVSLPGASKAVHDLSFQSTGKLIAVGSFDAYDFQQSKHGIVRLNPDGIIDVFFDIGQGPNFEILVSQPLNNDNLLIGGWFTSYNGFPAGHIARLHENGALDTSFNYSGIGASRNIGAITLEADGKILIGGDFAYYNGILRRGIARLYNCNTPQPASISGEDSTLCPGEIHVYSVPSDAKSYEWTLPAGWIGNSDSASIVVTSNGQGGVISVRAFSDSCGYSLPRTKTVYRVPVPEQPICLVTVDDSSTHNIVVWEKITTHLVDSFFIYRETATNVYTKIGSVSYHDLSEYHDYDANPNATSYRYKISSVDTCGVESELSPFHNTIHLQYLGHGSFIWTFYEIEGASNPVTSFNVYRDALGDGNFQQIGLVPGTNATFTDIDHAAFPNSVYRVDVNWSRPCIAAVPTINTTRSNIRRKTDEVAIQTLSPEYISIHANPAEDVISVEFISSTVISRLRLLNTLGQPVWRETNLNTPARDAITLHVGALPKGIYILAVETNAGRLNQKVIIQ